MNCPCRRNETPPPSQKRGRGLIKHRTPIAPVTQHRWRGTDANGGPLPSLPSPPLPIPPGAAAAHSHTAHRGGARPGHGPGGGACERRRRSAVAVSRAMRKGKRWGLLTGRLQGVAVHRGSGRTGECGAKPSPPPFPGIPKNSDDQEKSDEVSPAGASVVPPALSRREPMVAPANAGRELSCENCGQTKRAGDGAHLRQSSGKSGRSVCTAFSKVGNFRATPVKIGRPWQGSL